MNVIVTFNYYRYDFWIAKYLLYIIGITER